ncbi:sugar transferase [Mucilaginibacter agri]|uniref:Lipid carrier--UDP-N-acetylgalactosaminyltransferase n=1 Tax=Mucilaginibacter agri TaxID=2695265 RepID=A0A965ZIZ1_9SPHI|nr:sugar transferase [Mucilaginibacter agri]NCD70561.1 lipid carrier--UDP-N-acetylgalactosaminyltransferase [Mucilaginibacter agri]
MYKTYFKRIFDTIVSLFLFVFLSPLFVLLSLSILIINKDSPFFLQARPGKNGKIFKVIKFKTMNSNRDSEGHLLSDKERLTDFGKWLRRTSLDELPQLINVIKGEMSLVGPRPLLPEYLPLYSDRQNKRHNARPGITGWAQINGRNAINWSDKFEYDVWYVENLSFKLDLKILKLTFNKVNDQADISSETSVTMEKFTGN